MLAYTVLNIFVIVNDTGMLLHNQDGNDVILEIEAHTVYCMY